MDTSNGNPLVVVVSNRGPFSFHTNEDGTFGHERGQGGLVTALSGVMAHNEVLWVAVALSDADREWAISHNDKSQNIDGTRLRLVRTEKKSYDQYYNVISNPLLWFVQHQLWDAPRKPDVDKAVWDAWEQGYVAINRQLAEVVAEEIAGIDRPVIVFPQDYHLYMLPHFLREHVGDNVQIQPFVHIPWPGPDAWRLLPSEMRESLLKSMLASDRVGFQTRRDAFNFVQCCRFYVPNAHSRGSRDSIEYQGRTINAATYPISIDVEKVQELAEEPQTRLLKSHLINYVGDSKLILRVDRIEPSKNILRGLQAFRGLLENHPEHIGKVQMVMLLVPSRMEVDEYQAYLQQIMAEAGMINAEYSDAFWEPVRVIVGDNYHRAIAAFQLYDVLLVNPIADGMNLVAKEGVLVNQRNGVLLLSEHAGVFYELGDHALIVSPFDLYSTAEGMHQALTMPLDERHRRAEALRNQVQNAGVRAWFKSQLDDSLSALASQPKKSSTPDTPSTRKSADSRTSSGVSSESTPKASA